MNHLRRKVWLPVLLVSTLMVLFPPWLYFDGNTSNQRSAGYHFFFSPPAVKSYDEMFGFPFGDMQTQFVRVRLNGLRLIAQVLTLAFFAAGLVLKLQGDWSYPLFLAVGICGIALLILLMLSKF